MGEYSLTVSMDKVRVVEGNECKISVLTDKRRASGSGMQAQDKGETETRSKGARKKCE